MSEREETKVEPRVERDAGWDLKVLVVDDDPMDLELAERFLGMCGAFNAVAIRAENAKKALQIAASTDLDCVLLDQNLPDLNGIELIDTLRVNAHNVAVPVILLTGHGDESLVVEAMHHGAADYMSKKELSPASLQRAIKNAVEKARLTRLLENEREVLVTMNHELLRKTREIESFYQTVSHELKTPLTALREYNSLMLDGVGGEVTDDQREFLTISLECCDRLAGLINDLLDTARMAADKLSIVRTPTKIDELVQRRINELKVTARNSGLTIDFSAAGDCMEHNVDSVRIGQVISNLLTNAIKFTECGGFISVKLESNEKQFQISVTDTGRGIPANEQSHIFERYYQVTAEQEMQSGMGIGLYLCASIARRHGGKINVDSKPGNGSTFTLTVPANAGQSVERAAA